MAEEGEPTPYSRDRTQTTSPAQITIPTKKTTPRIAHRQPRRSGDSGNTMASSGS